jgi:toxin-antitoxin system PIN domain toxin
LHATNPDAPAYDRAREWFEEQMNAGHRVGLSWFTLVSFVRLSTQKGVRPHPLSMADALEYVEGWLEWESVWTPEPTARHFMVFSELMRIKPRSDLVNDAHLAALAIEHGLTLCSADVGFRMFPDLKLHNPLQ